MFCPAFLFSVATLHIWQHSAQHKHCRSGLHPQTNRRGRLAFSSVVYLQQVRQDLNGHLTKINGDRDWSFILNQVGMFSFTGLNKVWLRWLWLIVS